MHRRSAGVAAKPEVVMHRALARLGVGVALGVTLGAHGCGDTGAPAPNSPPETFLTSSEPRDSSRVAHHIEILWRGADVDGTPVAYDYFVRTYPRSVARIDEITLQPPAAGDPGWRRITAPRLDLVVAADTLRADPRGDIGAGEFDRWHTFYVRAVDNEGAVDETPESRTFFAYTEAPRVWLNAPALRAAVADLPRTFVMHWDGRDPIGGPADPQNPLEARWALLPVTLDGGGQPIGFPAALYDLPDSVWSAWTTWAAADSSGREKALRDVVPQGAPPQAYVFVVQGRDDGGAITPKFDATTLRGNNYAVLRLDGSLRVGPSVTVHARQDTLSAWTFDGIGAPPFTVSVPYDTLHLSWDRPDGSRYGGRARESRYGWNIQTPNSDLEWTSWSTVRSAAPYPLAPGASEQLFWIQCRDHIGQVTTGIIGFTRTFR